MKRWKSLSPGEFHVYKNAIRVQRTWDPILLRSSEEWGLSLSGNTITVEHPEFAFVLLGGFSGKLKAFRKLV